MRSVDLFDRPAQDDLLQIRNDLMTVYREFSAADPRLFPLRYARTVPRRARRPAAGTGGTSPAGAPPQVPVLLIPDGPGRGSVLPYDVLRRALAGRGLDVLMMEHRGVGLSRLDSTGEDLPASVISVREVLDDLLAVLDHARVPRVSVYGVGYGAYLAQALAALHPGRVHSLVLDSPLTGADDERVAQAALRGLYWEGTEPSTSTIASTLRRLAAEGVIDAHRAGPVVLAVHEHGGPSAVRDLVDLLALGRGQLTWNSVRQVLNQEWLQNTPYVMEYDLTARISHSELGHGHHADGGPLDPLVVVGQQARAVPPFTGEVLDLHQLAPAITAPTLVLTGRQDLVSPPVIARELVARIPGADLLEVPRAGHSMLDTRSQITQVAARWSAFGAAHLLPQYAAELTALPATPTDQALSRGLQIALAVERYSPWRLWVESAKAKREQAHVDPRARRTRHVKLD
ncbi:lysophospholipase [Brachybacterium sp. P6-10-X1]|uniref:alpha/beta hydrolase n=1 Tax=Brachybacterium sp. P6-10-X1 TaxID=1903186 RepID=UPI000971B7BA|nr:alpha/beta hydrolase [Brachybacterium sp. P6-10-X1]APX34270.1 lysophospholipase [Brachybacterium sp. P6-10-X1]